MTTNSGSNRDKHTPLPPPKKIGLHNLSAIRREMNSVYRDARNKAIESQEGTKFIYMLNIILKAYESEILENELNLIKDSLQARNNIEHKQDK